MGKLSIFLVIAIIFVALFGATGVFADSSSTSPTFVVGEQCPLFTEVLSGGKIYFDCSDLEVGIYPIMNNFELVVETASTNSYTGYIRFPSGSTYISGTSTTFYKSSPIVCEFTNGDYFVFRRTDGGPTGIAPNVYIWQATPIVSFGTEYVYTFPAPPVIGEVINFTIPTGYALLIQGSCDILERDYAINNSWNFYQNDARRVNGSRERVISTGSIVDGFSFDHNLTYSQAIQWIPRNANLFGSSSNYDYSDHTILSISSGSTFLISNPQYIGTMENVGNVQTKENTVPLTGTIYFEYSTRPTFKYIALESQIDFNQVGVYYNVFRPDVYDEIASTTVDGTDVIVSPDYTGTTVPPDGGNSGQPPYNPDETVEGVLSNFINNIRSLISSATQAISDLVNTGSSFMQSIATMFTWLPSPLLSVIIGGLTILLVVGVLKVLWR